MLFSALVYCDQMKMEFFLDNLILNETPRTIIQTIINTLESGKIKIIVNEQMVSKFYLVMKKMFNLQYDRILLATASAAHLDLPYLLPYREEMDRCRNGTSCHQITQAIDTLGKE